MHGNLIGCFSVPISCVPHDGGGMVLAVVVSIDLHCCERSTEQMYHSLLLRQPGDSQFGAIMNSATLNGQGCVVWCGCISISGGSSPSGEFWAYICSVFVGTVGLSYYAALPVHAPTSDWGFPLGHILNSTWHFLAFHFSHSGGRMAV